MVLVKIWQFFLLFILGRKGQENVFGGILERKNAFLDYKDRRFIKSKIGIILKRLVHGFCQEIAMFPFLLNFRQNRPEKCVSRYSRKKKRLSRLSKQVKTRASKIRKISIFPKGFVHSFCSKICNFSVLLF